MTIKDQPRALRPLCANPVAVAEVGALVDQAVGPAGLDVLLLGPVVRQHLGGAGGRTAEAAAVHDASLDADVGVCTRGVKIRLGFAKS